METLTTTPTTKACECGCGAEVTRRFRPGHDAKLKGALLTQTRSADWWVREAAIDALIERSWGHFINPEILSCARETSRRNGRFVESRHVENVGRWNLDQDEVNHSHPDCPAIVGRTKLTDDRDAGWLCGTCSHTHTKAENVAFARMIQVAMAD